MDDSPQLTLAAVAEELYAADLAEFTEVRDAHARAAKSYDPALATQIKQLKKPTVAAWVVNLLVRDDVARIDEIIELAASLQQAAAALEGAQLRELTTQRRQLTAALTTQAKAVAHRRGHRVSEAVADQIEATLTAALLDAGCASALRSGMLVTSVTATGVELIDPSTLVAWPGAVDHLAQPGQHARRHGMHVVTPADDAAPDTRALDAAKAAHAEAEKAAAIALAALTKTDEALNALAADALRVGSHIDELRRQIAQLEAELEQIDDDTEEQQNVRADQLAAHDALVAAVASAWADVQTFTNADSAG